MVDIKPHNSLHDSISPTNGLAALLNKQYTQRLYHNSNILYASITPSLTAADLSLALSRIMIGEHP